MAYLADGRGTGRQSRGHTLGGLSWRPALPQAAWEASLAMPFGVALLRNSMRGKGCAHAERGQAVVLKDPALVSAEG